MIARTFASAWWTSLAVAVLAASLACSKPTPDTSPAVDASVVTSVDGGAGEKPGAAAPAVVSEAEGRALVTGACLSCHSSEMLAQQRLTAAQWQKTVTKMVGWGAPLDPTDAPKLTAYLAATYGPDAGPYTPPTITAADAVGELAPLEDGPFAGGDAVVGRPLFIDKCGGCHGQDARGGIGVLLVDRPILARARDLAATVRRGRGKMPPVVLSDREIADVLAFLRGLRNAPPPP